jgi:hypothetical protein
MLTLAIITIFMSIPFFILSNILRLNSFYDKEKQAKNDRNQLIATFLGTVFICFGTTMMFVLALAENGVLKESKTTYQVTCYSDGKVIFSSNANKVKFSGNRAMVTDVDEKKWVINNSSCVNKQN